MTQKLKPCPFCGADEASVEVIDYDFYGVQCYCCKATGPTEETKAEAIDAWNRRAGRNK